SLMNSLMQHKSALDQAAIVCELDTLGRITGVNELFVEHSGRAREALLGLPLVEVGRAADPGRSWTPDGAVWNGEVVVDGARGMGSACAALFEIKQAGQLILRAGAGRLAEAQGLQLGCALDPLAAPADETGLRDWFAPLAGLHALGSSLDAGIVCTARLFGVIGVYADGARRFGEVDAQFLASIARILATAVERHDARDRLTWLAQYDALTRLPNRH